MSSRFYIERPDDDGHGFVHPTAVVEATIDTGYPSRHMTRLTLQGPPEVVARTPSLITWPGQLVEVDGPARLLANDERDGILAAMDQTSPVEP